jgi:hypothetical protein
MRALKPTKTKKCKCCGKRKAIHLFVKHKPSKTGYGSWCKKCKYAKQKEYREKCKLQNANTEILIHTKICGTCEIEKDINEYGKCKDQKDGLRSVCKQCRHEEYNHRYATDPEFRKKELTRVNIIHSRPESKAKNSETRKIWAQNNPDKLIAMTHRRRAKKLGRINEIYNPIEIKQKFNYQCYYCEEKAEILHLDHIVPFHQGGHNIIENIVVACQWCNCSKNRKMLIHWRQTLLFILEDLLNNKKSNRIRYIKKSEKLDIIRLKTIINNIERLLITKNLFNHIQ